MTAQRAFHRLYAFRGRFGVLVLALAALAFAFAPAALAEPFQTSAPVALLVDVSSGMTLLAKNIDRSIEPAAMAKMMTVAVVAEALAKGETTLDTEYAVSEEAWRRGGAPS